MAGLGDYQIGRQIGAGASGTVWEALRLGPVTQTVAVKRLRGANSEDEAAQLRREAMVLTELDHPHIIRIVEVVPDGEGVAICMQYAPGGSLEALLAQRGRLAPGEVVAVAAPVAAALASAHRRGILHVDVKPANILFTSDGEPLLSDFGVARTLGRLTSVLGAHHPIAGTAHYLAPELLDGAAPDARSDVYSLAIVCYEALTGKRPYDAALPLAVLRAADTGRHQPLTARRDVPKRLARVIEKAMARDPDKRIATADLLARSLREALPPSEVRLPGPATAPTPQVPIGPRTPPPPEFPPPPPAGLPVTSTPPPTDLTHGIPSTGDARGDRPPTPTDLPADPPPLGSPTPWADTGSPSTAIPDRHGADVPTTPPAGSATHDMSSMGDSQTYRPNAPGAPAATTAGPAGVEPAAAGSTDPEPATSDDNTSASVPPTSGTPTDLGADPEAPRAVSRTGTATEDIPDGPVAPVPSAASGIPIDPVTRAVGPGGDPASSADIIDGLPPDIPIGSGAGSASSGEPAHPVAAGAAGSAGVDDSAGVVVAGDTEPAAGPEDDEDGELLPVGVARDDGLEHTRTFGPRPPQPPEPEVRRRRPWLPATVMAGVAAVGLLYLVLGPLRSGDDDCPDAARPFPEVGHQIVSGDPEGDGCTTHGVYALRTPARDSQDMFLTIRVGGRQQRIRMGELGDRLHLGDWDCDGTDTPGLYRRRQGEVHYYDTWPESGRNPDPYEPERTDEVPAGGRTELVEGDDQEREGTGRPRCDRIRVTEAG